MQLTWADRLATVSAKDGELYILDLGPAYRGYYADNCRTIAVNRRPTDEQYRSLGEDCFSADDGRRNGETRRFMSRVVYDRKVDARRVSSRCILRIIWVMALDSFRTKRPI